MLFHRMNLVIMLGGDHMRYKILFVLPFLVECAINTKWYESPVLSSNYQGESNSLRDDANLKFDQCKKQMENSYNNCNRYSKIGDWGTGVNIAGGLVALLGGSTVVASGNQDIKNLAGGASAIVGGAVATYDFISLKLEIPKKIQNNCGPFYGLDSTLDELKRRIDVQLLTFQDEFATAKRDSIRNEVKKNIIEIANLCRY
jgi:hypothetical protein